MPASLWSVVAAALIAAPAPPPPDGPPGGPPPPPPPEPPEFRIILDDNVPVYAGDKFELTPTLRDTYPDGDAPATWTISDGVLPAGLVLNATTGTISGTTPTTNDAAPRNYQFTLTAQRADRTITADHALTVFTWQPPGALRAIDGSGHVNCAVTERERAVFCWGEGRYGTLGHGGPTKLPKPGTVTGIVGRVSTLSVGVRHACATTEAGRVFCWGQNDHGEANPTAIGTTQWQATEITGLPEPVRHVSTGIGFTCIAGDHTYCWGDPRYTGVPSAAGPIANGREGVTDAGSPAEPPSMPTSLAGTLNGNPSSGPVTPRNIPVVPEAPWLTQVDLPGTVRSLTSGYHHTCAVVPDGSAWCWGDNDSGETGSPTRDRYPTPTPVAKDLPQLRSVHAHFQHTCAVALHGDVWCWGTNHDGQLGVAPAPSVFPPAQMTAITERVSSLSTGVQSTCGVTRRGAGFCLGNADGVGRSRGTGGPIFPEQWGRNMRSVSANVYTTCGTTRTGEATCGGYNREGSVGVGAFTQSESLRHISQ